MFIKDPCGIVCILVTYIAVFYADYVVIKWIILQSMQNSLWGPINVVAFNTVVFLLAMAHMKAVLSDPGTVPLPQTRLDFSDIHSVETGCEHVDWTVCTRCETYRPPRAHHCRICQRCIRRMDHHCPWINNCVGERNQKYFIQFLVYVGVLSCYAIVLVIVSWIYECKDCIQEISVKQSKLLHCIILLLESVLFGMFVSAILVEQIQAILGDETYIEQVQQQGPYRPQKPKLALLSEVCGRQHPLLWLLPCTGVHRKLDTPLIDHHVCRKKNCIPGCKTNYASIIDLGNAQCFRFPKEPTARHLWTQSIPRNKCAPSYRSVVCIKHCRDEDLDRNKTYINYYKQHNRKLLKKRQLTIFN